MLERARHSGQGSLVPNRTLSDATLISNATPFTWGAINVRTDGAGTRLIFSSTGNVDSGTPTHYAQSYGRDGATGLRGSGAGEGVPTPRSSRGNCRQYSATNWKPEGKLIEGVLDPHALQRVRLSQRPVDVP